MCAVKCGCIGVYQEHTKNSHISESFFFVFFDRLDLYEALNKTDVSFCFFSLSRLEGLG